MHREHRRNAGVLRAPPAAGRRAAARPRARHRRRRAAREHLLEHVRICFDCCHFAVEFEDAARGDRADPQRPGSRSAASSSARRSTCRCRGDRRSRAGIVERLRPFADTTYLHQVVEQRERRTCAIISICPTRSSGPAMRRSRALAHSLSRAAVRRRLRPARLDAVVRGARCLRHMLRAPARPRHLRDRDLHLGRAAARPEGGPARIDRAASTTGCCATAGDAPTSGDLRPPMREPDSTAP